MISQILDREDRAVVAELLLDHIDQMLDVVDVGPDQDPRLRRQVELARAGRSCEAETNMASIVCDPRGRSAAAAQAVAAAVGYVANTNPDARTFHVVDVFDWSDFIGIAVPWASLAELAGVPEEHRGLWVSFADDWYGTVEDLNSLVSVAHHDATTAVS